MDSRYVRKYLNTYNSLSKLHHPRPIHLVTDATYFGERKKNTSWCSVVARDPYVKEDLVWQFADTETTYAYSLVRDELEALGYTILSVTGDGFPGIKAAFFNIPFQMCHVHMERLVVKGTTRNPQTEAGQVLLALTRTLYDTNSKTFNRRLDMYIEKYRDFLNEKTTNPLTDEQYWTHKELRQALHRLLRHQRYLFTFEQNKNIPKTTNSLEGHFTHTKKMVGVHGGLSRPKKEKVLNTIFLASTTAPKVDKLDEIL
ncbi:MAG: transposase [Candidatus Uhrbacteria bacterium]